MDPGDARLPVAAVAALQEGNKIQAIKLVREATGLGLKEAHDLVSAHIARDPALREQFGAMAARGRHGCLLIIGAVAAAVVAIIVSQYFARVGTGAAGASVEAWLGRWTGPEGTWLEISGGPGTYQITIKDLDTARTFAATADGQGMAFQRDGARETLRATDGQATGMKWLAERKNCLTVKSGEGYCRD